MRFKIEGDNQEIETNNLFKKKKKSVRRET